ncbi:MAG: hypothetical protein ABI304_01970 [Rudaea sp.]
MTWQPGQPIATISDVTEWQAWKKSSRLEAQRSRRKRYRRIDYYPSKRAQALIDSRTGHFAGGDYSTVIDALVLAGAEGFPE